MRRLLAKFLLLLSLLLLAPLILAAYYEFGAPEFHPQPHATLAFTITILIAWALAATLWIWGRSRDSLHRREGILLVVAIWLVTSCISALPFVLSGTLKPLDAYFEAMSGLTTTGATMISAKSYNAAGEEIPVHITNPHVPGKTYSFYGTVAPIRESSTGLILHAGVEAVSKAVLLWRSLLQWIGGLGIVVIFLTVLPALHVGGKFLYQMETTGPIKEGITPRIRETAARLWKLYLALTGAEIALLLLTNHNLPLFDAVCIALSNISTGGFAVREGSIGAYHSSATEWVVFAFMLIGSLNFSLYFRMCRSKLPDLLLFLGVVVVGCLFVSFPLLARYPFADAFRLGSFQALSMQSSTGFTTANYDLWPFVPQMFMLLLMFVGGMSGSTAGGIKTSRFYILFKIVQHRLESIYRPDSIRRLRIGGSEVDDKNALTVLAFFCIVAVFVIIGTVGLALDHIDPETSLGLIACFLNNVGAAFRAAGPVDSFCFLSPLAKVFSILWMLLGRLEYYAVLLLLLPSFWKLR